MHKLGAVRSFIYKWRYPIGYTTITICLIAALLFAGAYIPGGLSKQEILSTIQSNKTTVNTLFTSDVINLPYHLLQHLSFRIFGVTTLSIKLPSILLAFASIIGMVLLLQQWFKPNIGVLATLIAITTGQFLFIAQNGTPEILYFFWPVWLILVAAYIPIKERFRKLYVASFFALAALSLYTPLSLYILIVISGAIILHPHLRFLIKQLTTIEIVMGFFVIALIVSPLALAIFKTPDLALHLLGWPAKAPNIITNLQSLGVQYFNFMGQSSSTNITPFFELGSVLLIALGSYYIFKSRATAKSYVIILWTLCLIPVIILNPDLTSVTFLPLVLLLASGINGLLSYWYDLFPLNPYARVGGLIPIIILVIVLVSSGINRYVYGYTYGPSIVNNFSYDLRLIPKDTKHIVVSSADSELEFYAVMSKFNKNIYISTSPYGDSFVATKRANRAFAGYSIDKITTSSNSNNSDRFYSYKKS